MMVPDAGMRTLVEVRYIKMGNQEFCVGPMKFEMLWNNQIQVI